MGNILILDLLVFPTLPIPWDSTVHILIAILPQLSLCLWSPYIFTQPSTHTIYISHEWTLTIYGFQKTWSPSLQIDPLPTGWPPPQGTFSSQLKFCLLSWAPPKHCLHKAKFLLSPRLCWCHIMVPNALWYFLPFKLFYPYFISLALNIAPDTL